MAKAHLSRFQQQKLDAAFAKADREAALRKQGGRCLYCMDPLTLKQVTRDHKQPRSAGGLDHKKNIVAACGHCNSVKGSIPFKQFVKLIEHPQPGDPIRYRLIWMSRRVNTRLVLMRENLMRAVGGKK